MSLSRCEYCGKLCSATTACCDECRALLQNQYQTVKLIEVGQEGEGKAAVGISQSMMPSSREAEQSREDSGGESIFERITSPVPIVRAREVETPLPPVQEEVQETYNLVEQALNRLNDAARRIAKAEGQQRRHPHASRLTPLRDISAKIRRESTPYPGYRHNKTPIKMQIGSACPSCGPGCKRATRESRISGPIERTLCKPAISLIVPKSHASKRKTCGVPLPRAGLLTHYPLAER